MDPLKSGDVITLRGVSGFMGCQSSVEWEQLRVVQSPRPSDSFKVEQNHLGYSLKHVGSSLYLGGLVVDGDAPVLSPIKETFQFHLQQRDSLEIVGKHDLRLTCEGNKVVWRKNPVSSEAKWQIVMISSDEDDRWSQGAEKEDLDQTMSRRSSDSLLMQKKDSLNSNPKSQNQQPYFRSGQKVAIEWKQKPIGKVRNINQDVEVVDHVKEWEEFEIEVHGDKYAFRQLVSGLYLGRHIDHGDVLQLASKRGAWESFYLEKKENGQFSIKSLHNTYLGIHNYKPIWSIFMTTTKWTIRDLNASNDKAQKQGVVKGEELRGNKGLDPGFFFRSGEIVALEINRKALGKVMRINEDLEVVNQVGAWQAFEVQIHGNQYAFKQLASNNYLGRHINHGSVMQLAAQRNAWEYFTLQRKGDHEFSIKSANGTYLCLNKNKPTWNNNHSNVAWTIRVLNSGSAVSEQHGYNRSQS